jgi:hypothetical protein
MGFNMVQGRQANRLIFKDYAPRNRRFQGLEHHFHAPKCHRKGLRVPGASRSHPHHSPHASLPLGRNAGGTFSLKAPMSDSPC